MNILGRFIEWRKRRARLKEARRRIDEAARAHARRSIECGLCHDALHPDQFALGFCSKCWSLRDENSVGVRPMGLPS